MVWAVPSADAVTLGEMDGELFSVTPRDELHLGGEFVRRGGAVFAPARVARLKQRRPFGQQESLTEQDRDDDSDRRDPRAVQLARHALRALRVFFVEDERRVVRSVVDAAAALLARTVIRPVGDDSEDASAFLAPSTSRARAAQESIVTVAWHPTLRVLAVAQSDGVVALYDLDTAAWDPRVLEHSAQEDITSVQWARFSGGVLAVACSGGIFLWKVACTNKRQELELLDVVTHPTKKAFHQVSWNEDGSLLAAFAEHSGTVFVIDVNGGRRAELQCSQSVTGIQWSPTGEYLFVSTASGVSLMWETLTWKKEIWSIATATYAWSSNGRCLLVSPRNTSVMYPYEFRTKPPSIDVCMNTPAIDFAEKEVSSLDQTVSEFVGGKINSLTWDPTSARIAVTYVPSTSTTGDVGPLVAIYSVTWKPFLIFTQSGLIRGPPNAGLPRTVAFATSFNQGALLSVAWSSGLISFHPFYLQES